MNIGEPCSSYGSPTQLWFFRGKIVQEAHWWNLIDTMFSDFSISSGPYPIERRPSLEAAHSVPFSKVPR